MDNLILSQHLLYLTFSLTTTWWVGRTLFKNGAVFLVDAFLGKETLADSVNHLLLVGFYLVNGGWVVSTLKHGWAPQTPVQVLENVAQSYGTVLLILGGMHFFNLYVLNRLRRRGLAERQSAPVSPDAWFKAEPSHVAP